MNKLFNESCFETMKRIESNTIDIIVTSPPYNENKKYNSYNDNLSLIKWLEFIKLFLMETKRILKKDGRICLNLAESGRSPSTPKPHLISSMMFEMGFMIRGNIIWHKPGYKGCAWGSWQSPSNPTITDNSEYIIVASNEIMKKKGKKENIDITKDEFKDWITGHWVISPSSNKQHPCIFPKELVKRCLKLYSFIGDVVYDPFMGIGTTAVVAKELKRNFIGSEIDENYYKISLNNINNDLEGEIFK